MPASIDKQPTPAVEKGPWARPIVKKSLSDRAYDELRLALMRGHLSPGDQLPVRPLSERFGISATPMREALARLVVERALTLDARGTVTVPHLTLDQLLEIRAIRHDLEGRCAARAAEHADEAQVDALQQLHDLIIEAQQNRDFPTAIALNTQFHLKLCEIARLPVTYEIVEGLWVRCGPILAHLYDGGLPFGAGQHPHQTLVTALRDRNPEAARLAICDDIERGGQGLLAYVSD